MSGKKQKVSETDDEPKQNEERARPEIPAGPTPVHFLGGSIYDDHKGKTFAATSRARTSMRNGSPTKTRRQGALPIYMHSSKLRMTLGTKVDDAEIEDICRQVLRVDLACRKVNCSCNGVRETIALFVA